LTQPPTLALRPYTTLFRSRSHRSWTVDGRIFRMTSSRVVSEPLEAHPVARRVRTATPRASLMPAHSDREHSGQQILSSASGVAQDRKSTRLNSSHEWMWYA